MKKYMLSFAFLFAAIAVIASTPKGDNYVQTKNDIVYYSKISFGPTKARLILDNGKKITLMNNELIAYKKDGRIFEKLPLFVNNKPTKKEVFMEVLKYTNGMKLYRYHNYLDGYNFMYSTNSATPVNEYYVFKNGNYHLQLDANNYQTVFNFFGIKSAMK
jgi:hypothetical protein